ncbi:hypothetical protein [Pseudoxanthomonas sp.]|uniref:hypothetical protein n=1 Tax=Pseudoxanthomonas sp. TaxID=1871049 RepID=UPI00262FD776|nr:hypothetical protein [Pseudoxanthomonas sp.]WDS37368.1 MAG: hypothetical protein O8I58_05665 [Pseudoxanthomonas sp.]
MAVEDLAEGVFRFFGRMLVEVVVEIAIKGTGYVVLGSLRPRAEPSETAATVTGLCLWVLLIGIGIGLWHASTR